MLTLTHTSGSNEYWAEYGPAAGGVGGDESLLAFALHLADDRSTPEQMTQFGASDEGHRFLTSTVAAWQAAHEATGVDSAVAAVAASRALHAYKTDAA